MAALVPHGLPPMEEMNNFMLAFRRGQDFDAPLQEQVNEEMEYLNERIEALAKDLLGESEEARQLAESLNNRVGPMDYKSAILSFIDHLKQTLQELKANNNELIETLDPKLEAFWEQQKRIKELSLALENLIQTIRRNPSQNPYSETIVKSGLIACLVISHKMHSRK